MRYVIIRDDDTNALTPVACLERLYRPFLDRGLPVNLAVIPDVATDTRMSNGQLEGFLMRQTCAEPFASTKFALDPPKIHGEKATSTGTRQAFSSSTLSPPPFCYGRSSAALNPSQYPLPSESRTLPIGEHAELVRYLLDNPDYRIVQHGCHHDYIEFDRPARAEVAERLDRGARLLMDAGFARPDTFVAPYDKLSRASLMEVAARFRILSTGWFELRRLPRSWWPNYALKKMRHAPHWRMGNTLLLSHPGCLLSYQNPRSAILGAIARHINAQKLTVLVTHWWEYFRDGRPDLPFIELLYETADYLARQPGLKVISFSDLLHGNTPLN